MTHQGSRAIEYQTSSVQTKHSTCKRCGQCFDRLQVVCSWGPAHGGNRRSDHDGPLHSPTHRHSLPTFGSSKLSTLVNIDAIPPALVTMLSPGTALNVRLAMNLYLLYIFAVFIFIAHSTLANDETNDVLPKEFTTKEDIQTYFMLKRKQQLDAIQTLLKFQRYEQKYEMMRKIYEKIFEILNTSRDKVENSGFMFGEELPNSEVIEAVLLVLENCAFFGNLALKLPDISDRLLKQNKANKWVDSYKWCFNFAISSGIIDEYSLKMFNLAAQQLNLQPKSDDFINPYEEKNKKKIKSAFSNNRQKKANQKKQKNSQIKKTKGPRMSKVEL